MSVLSAHDRFARDADHPPQSEAVSAAAAEPTARAELVPPPGYGPARTTGRHWLRRLRRTSLAASLLVAVAYGASLVWSVAWEGACLGLDICSGALYFSNAPHAAPLGWLLRRSDMDVRWDYGCYDIIPGSQPFGRRRPPALMAAMQAATSAPASADRLHVATSRPTAAARVRGSVAGSSATYYHGWFPLWIPLVAAASMTLLFWALERQPLPWQCRQCGYDLTGNVSGRCPECGRPISAIECDRLRAC